MDNNETENDLFQTPPDIQSNFPDSPQEDSSQHDKKVFKLCEEESEMTVMMKCSSKKCKSYYHFACTGMPAHMLTYIRRVSGAPYICNECESTDEDIVQASELTSSNNETEEMTSNEHTTKTSTGSH